MTDSSKPKLTDSPWFWALLFSAVGLILLAVISGQYGKRQARLERQYQARERVQEDAVGDPTRPAYSTPERTLISLWPIFALLIGAIILSAVMLRREHQRRPDELPG